MHSVFTERNHNQVSCSCLIVVFELILKNNIFFSLTEIKKSLATLATEVAKQAEKLKAYVNSIGESITTIQSKLK